MHRVGTGTCPDFQPQTPWLLIYRPRPGRPRRAPQIPIATWALAIAYSGSTVARRAFAGVLGEFAGGARRNAGESLDERERQW